MGCEIESYRYGDLQIVIPKLYGAETRKSPVAGASPGRKRWEESVFFEDVKARLGESAEEKNEGPLSIRSKYRRSDLLVDRGARGSFNPKYEQISARSVFTVFSIGALQINFGWLNDGESTVLFRKKLRQALTEEAGLSFLPDWEERLVTFPPDQWLEKAGDVVAAFALATEGLAKKAN